jgi:hypothetical protein
MRPIGSGRDRVRRTPNPPGLSTQRSHPRRMEGDAARSRHARAVARWAPTTEDGRAIQPTKQCTDSSNVTRRGGPPSATPTLPVCASHGVVQRRPPVRRGRRECSLSQSLGHDCDVPAGCSDLQRRPSVSNARCQRSPHVKRQRDQWRCAIPRQLQEKRTSVRSTRDRPKPPSTVANNPPPGC